MDLFGWKAARAVRERRAAEDKEWEEHARNLRLSYWDADNGLMRRGQGWTDEEWRRWVDAHGGPAEGV